jgi:hypothetical protein
MQEHPLHPAPLSHDETITRNASGRSQTICFFDMESSLWNQITYHTIRMNFFK